jgi:hypothetical protein
MPASVERGKTTTKGVKATRHTYFFIYYRTVLAPCFQRLVSGSSKAICEAPPQVMIVRPRCAWCMEACCLFSFACLLVPSCSLSCPSCVCSRQASTTQLLDLPSRSAPLLLWLLLALGANPSKVLTHIKRMAFYASAGAPPCVCHDARSSSLGQARPNRQ